jgi:hypothetical protein
MKYPAIAVARPLRIAIAGTKKETRLVPGVKKRAGRIRRAEQDRGRTFGETGHDTVITAPAGTASAVIEFFEYSASLTFERIVTSAEKFSSESSKFQPVQAVG